MRFNRAPYSRCESCPLNDQKRVWGDCGRQNPEILIIGEAPGRQEAEEGRPFVGPAGSMLNHVLMEAGLLRRSIWITNVIACRPPQNKMDSMDAATAVECCRPGFQKELERLAPDLRVIVPVGNHAMHALGINGGITRLRGFVHEVKIGKLERIAIPTYHPSYIMRGAKGVPFIDECTWIEDFSKIARIARYGWVRPKERFTLFPSVGDVEALRDRILKKKSITGVDVETLSLRPYGGSLVVIGIGESAECATVIPILKSGGDKYWSYGDEMAVRGLLQDILGGAPLIFQSATFDVQHLEANGFSVGTIAEDTLLLHHAIHPELPHNLPYIVSLYGDTPYWKGEFMDRSGSILNMEDVVLRTYNARDAVVLLQVLEPLLQDLEISGTTETYRDVSLELIRPVVSMTTAGVLLDKAALVKWRASLTRKEKRIEKRLGEIAAVPASFNFSSSDHLDLLLGRGRIPEQFTRAVSDLEEYEKENTRRKKDSKRYRDLVEKASLLVKRSPFSVPSEYRYRYTEGGRYSYDEESLLWMRVAVNNRLEKIGTFLKKSDAHDRETAELQRLILFLKTYSSYQETTKLLTTYTDYPVWPDGRVHPTFKIHGTATGRLSSGGDKQYRSRDDKINMQTIPDGARHLFIAPPGYRILCLDYSQLELRVLAYVSNDPVLIDMFDRGVDVHDAHTKYLFQIDKSHPSWKLARRGEKSFIFGMSYLGGIKKLYIELVKEVPDLGLTMARLKTLMDDYKAMHPRFQQWVGEVSDELFTSRPPRIRNAFGRLRIFLGKRDDVLREGVNHCIQSTAADIKNRAMIGIHDELRHGTWKSRLLLDVHDELVFEAHEKEQKKLIALARCYMEQPHTVGEYEVRFPVSVSIGPSWGEQKEL